MKTIFAAALALLVAGCSGSPSPSFSEALRTPTCRIVGDCLLPDGGDFTSDPGALDYVCDPGVFPVPTPGRDCLADSTRGGGAMCCSQEGAPPVEIPVAAPSQDAGASDASPTPDAAPTFDGAGSADSGAPDTAPPVPDPSCLVAGGSNCPGWVCGKSFSADAGLYCVGVSDPANYGSVRVCSFEPG